MAVAQALQASVAAENRTPKATCREYTFPRTRPGRFVRWYPGYTAEDGAADAPPAGSFRPCGGHLLAGGGGTPVAPADRCRRCAPWRQGEHLEKLRREELAGWVRASARSSSPLLSLQI